jgi:hypothetical protein
VWRAVADCSVLHHDIRVLSKFAPKKRLGKPRGSPEEVAVRSVSAILKVLLNPSFKLPAFSAVSLTRLPPIDMKHVDISAILAELSSLRQEVHEIYKLRQEVQQLQSLLHNCTSVTPGDSSHVSVDKLPLKYAPASATTVSDSACGDALTPGAGDNIAHDKTFAGVASRMASNPASVRTVKPKNKLIIGAAVDNKHLKAVMTKRNVDVFISRLHPETAAAELVDCVKSVTTSIDVLDVNCMKLKSKYENLYCSYHVAITVDAAKLKDAVEVFMSAAVWPCGVFVKRFFKPKIKNGSNQQ